MTPDTRPYPHGRRSPIDSGGLAASAGDVLPAVG
jgi:hypothetical protein